MERYLQKSQPRQVSEVSEPLALTPEEVEEALALARRKKQVEADRKAYWERVYKPVKVAQLNREELWSYAKHRFLEMNGREFVIDDFNKGLVNTLLLYFMQDTEFEQIAEGYSLKKGLLLFGNVGCGKTSIMKMFGVNPLQSYITISCRQVAAEYADTKDKNSGGEPAIRHYWYENYLPVFWLNPFRHQSAGICFDDLGTEETSRHYGNEKNVMAEIIMNRYDRHYAFQHKTHLTTNLNADQIEEYYGSRCRSRLREMFNAIELPMQPDRRV